MEPQVPDYGVPLVHHNLTVRTGDGRIPSSVTSLAGPLPSELIPALSWIPREPISRVVQSTSRAIVETELCALNRAVSNPFPGRSSRRIRTAPRREETETRNPNRPCCDGLLFCPSGTGFASSLQNQMQNGFNSQTAEYAEYAEKPPACVGIPLPRVPRIPRFRLAPFGSGYARFGFRPSAFFRASAFGTSDFGQTLASQGRLWVGLRVACKSHGVAWGAYRLACRWLVAGL